MLTHDVAAFADDVFSLVHGVIAAGDLTITPKEKKVNVMNSKEFCYVWTVL